jgi:type II secretory pathway pseudopilin PulG
MDTPVVVAIISAAASLAIAAITFFLTKRKEREAEWRKQKLEHYREFLDSLSGTVGTDSTPVAQRRWARAANTIGLVASQRVLSALWKFQNAIAKSNPNPSAENHDKALNSLMLAIRADLGVSPTDEPESFSFRLWCSGTNS